MFHVESLEEAPRVTPLCGDHHVVVRLVPEVVPDKCKIERDLGGHSEFLLHIIDGFTCLASPKFTLILFILHPEALRLESLPVKKDEVALPVLLGPIAQRRDHHVAVRQAVRGVRGAHAQGVHLPRLDDLRMKRGWEKKTKKTSPMARSSEDKKGVEKTKKEKKTSPTARWSEGKRVKNWSKV